MAQIEFEFEVLEAETCKNLLIHLYKLDAYNLRDIEIHLEIPYDLVFNLLESKSFEQFSRIIRIARFSRGNKTSISGSTKFAFDADDGKVEFFSERPSRRPSACLTLSWHDGVVLMLDFQGYSRRTFSEAFVLRGALEKIPKPETIFFFYSHLRELELNEGRDIDPTVVYRRSFSSISQGPPLDPDEEQGPHFIFDGVDRRSYFALHPANVRSYDEALVKFENSFLVKLLSVFYQS